MSLGLQLLGVITDFWRFWSDTCRRQQADHLLTQGASFDCPRPKNPQSLRCAGLPTNKVAQRKSAVWVKFDINANKLHQPPVVYPNSWRDS